MAFPVAGLPVATAALGRWIMGGSLPAPDTDSPDSRADSSEAGGEGIP